MLIGKTHNEKFHGGFENGKSKSVELFGGFRDYCCSHHIIDSARARLLTISKNQG